MQCSISALPPLQISADQAANKPTAEECKEVLPEWLHHICADLPILHIPLCNMKTCS